MKHILTLALLVGWSCAMGQHTPLTSQYLFNGLAINPAYAGSRDVLAANITHRQQWAGFDGAPVTQTLSIHAPLARRKVGLGLMLYNDRIGVSNETGLFSNYAYRMRFGKKTLSLGIGAGLTMLRANWTEVALQNMSDQSFSANTRNAVRANFSAGVFYYSKSWFMGASVPFLFSHSYEANQPTLTIVESSLQAQPMLTGGTVIELNKDLKLKPSTLLRYRVESGLQADISSNLIIKDKVWAGVSYRTGDAVIGMLEILPTPQWRVGYAYDMGLSQINRYHHGSHELMLQYEFGYRIRVRDPRYF